MRKKKNIENGGTTQYYEPRKILNQTHETGTRDDGRKQKPYKVNMNVNENKNVTIYNSTR